jgi:hypothetical protein
MVTYAFPRPPPAPVITTVCPVNDRVMVLCELVKRKGDESVNGDVGTWEEAVRVKSNAGHLPGPATTMPGCAPTRIHAVTFSHIILTITASIIWPMS